LEVGLDPRLTKSVVISH